MLKGQACRCVGSTAARREFYSDWLMKRFRLTVCLFNAATPSCRCREAGRDLWRLIANRTGPTGSAAAASVLAFPRRSESEDGQPSRELWLGKPGQPREASAPNEPANGAGQDPVISDRSPPERSQLNRRRTLP
jgi:hypothetical protein